MAESFLERVEKEILMMSGAMGTMLHEAGANLGGCVSQWIIEHPGVYRDLVRDYFQVGCDIVAGATSNLNRISLTKFGLAEKVEELNQGVIRIIKDIQPDRGFVAGNIGPTGKILKPLGELSPEELLEVYSQQSRALAESGVEIINILTMYDLEEAVIALRAAKTHTSLPVIVSLAFDPAARGYRTMMGVSPEGAAERLQREGADVIGANCGGINLEQMAEVIGLMKAHCKKPLIAKPNAGSPQVVEGREKYAAGPEQFAEHVGKWIHEGARIVSACCGSSPFHLEHIVKEVRKFR
ncbi:MAG: homocysteine S-methyltransferase family protein [Thermodesulfobacteriota bacterium]|nr:homocysteine S-methyltransferase family protein [Thermodesulfobacteriota bacterium]